MRFIFLFSFLVTTVFAFAQRNCGTALYAARFENAIVVQQNNNSNHRDTIEDEILTIPVVVHVLYNNNAQNISDAQIISQIDVLNEDFRRMNADANNTPEAFKAHAADAKIMFCLAQINPEGYAAKGIIRKYTSTRVFDVNDAMKYNAAGGDNAWNSKKYLNIWICNMGSNAIGYASQPGGQADRDGVVIQYNAFGRIGSLMPNFNKGRTATHEIAHWLGLRHIWGDNECGNDGINDTPQQAFYNNNCPSFPSISSCSPDNNGDMFMNFMDYTNDACMNMFTHGQKIKMRGQFAINGPRNSFMNSFACDSSMATAAPLPDDTITAVKTIAPSFKIYPNPATSELNIEGLNGFDLKGQALKIYSATGVLHFSKSNLNSLENINISHLNSGVYFVSIISGKDRKIVKLIKQ
jgi:hypothetical protein